VQDQSDGLFLLGGMLQNWSDPVSSAEGKLALGHQLLGGSGLATLKRIRLLTTVEKGTSNAPSPLA
jgi:hypothetical protein